MNTHLTSWRHIAAVAVGCTLAAPAWGQGVCSQAASIGLAPTTVAASGFLPSETGVLIARVVSAETLFADLAAQEQSHHQLMDQRRVLAEAVVLAAGDAEAAQQLQEADAQLAQSALLIEELRAGILTYVLDGQPTARIERLQRIRASASYSVPTEFRVVERTPQQWRELIRALRAEERALRLGETLSPQHAQLLATARAHSEVVQAAAQLATQLAAIETVFEELGE